MTGDRRDDDHPDYLGTCEGCGKLLFEGDSGILTDDGIWLCAAHCPSWRDAKRQWEAGENSDDSEGERRAEFMAAYEAHIAGGGSPDDLMSFPL